MSEQPDWAEQARRLVAGLSGLLSSDPRTPAASAASASGDCRWCPLCQAAAVLRGERPEVTAAMADVLTTAAAALRSFAGEAAEQGAPAPGAGAPAQDSADEPSQDGEDPATTTGPAVQRIEIA